MLAVLGAPLMEVNGSNLEPTLEDEEMIVPDYEDQGEIKLKDLVNELRDVTDWFTFGYYLGLEVAALQAVKRNQIDTDSCRREMLSIWMREQEPTWYKVVDALVELNLYRLAVKIASKYKVCVTVSKKMVKTMRGAIPEGEVEESEANSGVPSPLPPSSTAATGSGTAQPMIGLDLEAVDGTTVLDEDDLRDVSSAVVDLAGKWCDLGVSLRLGHGDLDAIRVDNPHSCRDCLRKLLTLWLKQRYKVERFGKPTWRRLVAAVEDHVGGNDPALAQRIARDHPAQEASPTPRY